MQQQISLYIALKKEERVSLATAARTALAFDALLKEVAFSVDPFSTIIIELQSGTEGSLSLNSIIRSVDKKISTLEARSILAGVLFFFAEQTASYTYEKFLDFVSGTPEIEHGLSREDVEAIAREVHRVSKDLNADSKAGKVFQELQADDSVTGVGVTTTTGKKPRYIVPRTDFPKRGIVHSPAEQEGKRKATSVQEFTLISPVLITGKKQRQWKFKQGNIEFGARVADQNFLKRLFSGREPVPMLDGILMKAVVTSDEEFKDGVWQIKRRTIDEVLSVTPPPEQTELPGFSG